MNTFSHTTALKLSKEWHRGLEFMFLASHSRGQTIIGGWTQGKNQIRSVIIQRSGYGSAVSFLPDWVFVSRQPLPTVVQPRGCSHSSSWTLPKLPCALPALSKIRSGPSWVQSTVFQEMRLLSLAYTLLSPRVQQHLLISSMPDSAGLVCLNTLKFQTQKAQKSAEFQSKMLTEEL